MKQLLAPLALLLLSACGTDISSYAINTMTLACEENGGLDRIYTNVSGMHLQAICEDDTRIQYKSLRSK